VRVVPYKVTHRPESADLALGVQPHTFDGPPRFHLNKAQATLYVRAGDDRLELRNLPARAVALAESEQGLAVGVLGRNGLVGFWVVRIDQEWARA
jgi:hypothetical protein